MHVLRLLTIVLQGYALNSSVLTGEAVCDCRRHVVEHKCRRVVPFVLCSEICCLARPTEDATIVQSRLRVRFALKGKGKENHVKDKHLLLHCIYHTEEKRKTDGYLPLCKLCSRIVLHLHIHAREKLIRPPNNLSETTNLLARRS